MGYFAGKKEPEEATTSIIACKCRQFYNCDHKPVLYLVSKNEEVFKTYTCLHDHLPEPIFQAYRRTMSTKLEKPSFCLNSER